MKQIHVTSRYTILLSQFLIIQFITEAQSLSGKITESKKMRAFTALLFTFLILKQERFQNQMAATK